VIRETEVDGVQTLLVPAKGPIRAGLTFRVGLADETLPYTGITHLTEHLALFRHGVRDYHYNGVTTTSTTTFHLEGSADDVVAFLEGVCRSLADLPVDDVVADAGWRRLDRRCPRRRRGRSGGRFRTD